MSPQKKTVEKGPVKKAQVYVAKNKTLHKAEKLPNAPVKKTLTCKPLESATMSGVSHMPNVGTYVLQKNRFFSVNSIFEKLTGYPRNELINAEILKHIHPEDRKPFKNNSQAILKSEKPEPYEYRWIRKDGETALFLETVCGLTIKGKPAVLGSVMDITRYSQAREKAQQQGNRYRMILEETELGYGELDPAGKFTFVNDAGARNLGYKPADIIGKNFQNFMDKAHVKKLRTMFKSIYKSGKPIKGVEVEFLHKDGSLRITELSATLLRDAGGNPVGFRGLSKDVTAARKAESELKLSEARLQSLFEITQFTAHDIIAMLDNALDHAIRLTGSKIGYIYYYNEEARQFRLLTWSKDVMKDCLITEPQTIYELDKTGIWGEAVRQRKPIVVNNYPAPNPLKKGYPEGHVHLHRFLTIPVLSGDKIIAVVGVANKQTDYNESDIRQLTLLMDAVWAMSERKRMETELIKKEEGYRTILEAIDEGYCEMDLTGKITYVNHAGARIIGLTPEKMTGTNFRQYITPAAEEELLNRFKIIYKSGMPVKRFEMEYINKEGIKRFLEVSGALMLDHSGKPAGFRGLAHDITHSKWTEEALLQSEAKYFSIVESIGHAYFETDLNGMLTFFNDQVCANLGYTRNELLRMSHRDLQDAANAKKTFKAFNRVYQTGEPDLDYIYEAICKDGSKAVFEVSVSLMRDAEGRPIGFRGLSRDITERKKMEDAIRQSEEKYRTIIETIEDGYVEVNLAGNWTFVNDVICSHMGYSREELLGMDFRTLHTEKSAQKSSRAFAEVYKTGKSLKALEIEAVRKDGSVGNYELSVSLMKDNQGEPAGFRCISRDITERKTMENALKASEERARTIVATIPDPYFETDLDGKMTCINQAFQSLSGYNLNELSQMHHMEYLGAKAAEDIFMLFNTVRTAGMTMKNIEVVLTNRAGEKRIVNLSVSLIRDPRGEPTGFHGIMRDVTDKKEAEALIVESSAKLLEYSESLEQSVRERTAELEKAKVEAEAASRAKSDFLANISHEFQTPLNAVVGFTKVLKDRLFGDLNPKQEEFVRYISEAGETLSKLLNDIIDVSSVSTGRSRLNLSSVSIPKVLAQTVSLLNRQIEEKGHTLSVDVDLDADVSIEADEEKIRHIFFQLLSNALKYTPSGGIITVAARRSRNKAGAEGVMVAVTDNGLGIRSEDISRLFQNFGRLESAYVRESSGVGVGLSLTRQLVELHGGDINVESEYGSGSTFSVFLPLAQKRPDSLGLECR